MIRPRSLVVRLTLLVACLVFAAPWAHAQPAAGDIDRHVARVMDAFDVPGVSLAIVRDGRVVTAKGYGVRRIGSPEPVDAQTLFGIASNTKVMTATALGILVDEGKVEWDAPVVRYLPWFQMWDPWVTRELTIRDLLVHRSGLGLGAGDLLWWPESTYTRRQIAERLRFIRPETSFRSAYAYDNVLYLVAGEVIEAVTGQAWEAFVGARVLARAGMATSNVRHSDAGAGGNVATPHARVDGTVRPIRPFVSDNTNPAGGVNANATDMAAWMQVLLAEGRLADGTRLVSERTFRQIVAPVTPIAVATPPAELSAMRANFRGYALGLNVTDYRGRRMLTHTGGLPGYVSRVTLVPDLGLGVAVLTNQESGEAFSAITHYIVDAVAGAADTDWLAAYQTVRARLDAAEAVREREAGAARRADSTPSLPLASYAATYADAWYGDIVVTHEGSRLVMRFTKTPVLVGDLEHWQHDTFVVRWRDRELRADAFVSFALDADGRVERARMRAVSPTTDFSFDFHDLLLVPVRR